MLEIDFSIMALTVPIVGSGKTILRFLYHASLGLYSGFNIALARQLYLR